MDGKQIVLEIICALGINGTEWVPPPSSCGTELLE